MAISMTDTEGTRYTLDDDGAVTARTNGPAGWDYSRQWIIRGFLRRWNSRQMVTLADALDGADIGHGFVVDRDHGTTRVWGNGRRCKALRRVDA